MTDLAIKSMIIADECRDAALDGSLIKALVSGDRASARNLYEGERINVHCRGKLWVISNKTLKLDYSDSALMDRLRVLPYNARWVPNPVEVKAKMTDMTTAMWVFKDDPYFKEKMLQTWGDALVTKCLYELHLFLLSLPRCPENPHRPSKLEIIPVPEVVKKATRDCIEREHPVLNFIRTYMAPTSSVDISDYVLVEICFSMFVRYGKNENNSKIKYMNRSIFQEDLLRQNITVVKNVGGYSFFKGYRMTKEVPFLHVGPDAPISADGGNSYVPPHIVAPSSPPPSKRHCSVRTSLLFRLAHICSISFFYF